MKDKNIIDRLLQDDVMQYISLRHHVTPKDVLDCFAIEKDGICHLSNTYSVDLEENEIQIIRDLLQMYFR